MKKVVMMGSGIPAAAAVAITGSTTSGLTAAGTTQGTALAVSDDVNVVTTTAAGTGVILPSNLTKNDRMVVSNHGANALLVYPPTGGAIDNGTANAGLSVAANATLEFICIDTVNFVSH